MVALIGTSAVVVAGAGVGAILLTNAHDHAKGSAAVAAVPLHVMSATPAAGSQGASGAAPIKLTLASSNPVKSLPVITPAVPGSWHQAGRTLTFTPADGFTPHTRVTVSGAGAKNTMWTDSFTTGGYSLLRLQQLLAELGYLPLSWAATDARDTAGPDDAAAQLAAAYTPPAGDFTWDHGYPATLDYFWRPGQPNLITTGAIMAFESEHGMNLGETVTPAVWNAVLRAAAAQQTNKNGYTYAIASKATPETLTIWHDGRRVFSSYANTGIPVSPTADGTFPVYLRYYFQIMKGTNPDGSHYADPVNFVAYFNGGDAVHYFPRYSYGWPQSLGCVELPYAAAEKAWPYLSYGSLVTVAPA